MKNLSLIFILIFFQMGMLFAGEWSTPIDQNKVSNPFEGQDNIYRRIFDELNTQYQIIGERQSQGILINNKLSVTGGLNSIGLNYNRPFGDFSISLDRNLAPDITDDLRWIVTDTFSIHIDAHKVIKNYNAQNNINLDEKTMAAFIGVVFKRTFTWVHFANSYEEGLTTHFEKLFLPFRSLNFESLGKLSNDEMIFKEDSISIGGGGFVSVPLYTGVSAMGGVLGKFQRMSRFEIISKNGNELQISLEKSKLQSLGVSASIQATFLKIIKLSLLSYDFEYSNESSYKIYTNFKNSDISEMTNDNPVANELVNIINNKEADLIVLAPFIISEEKKIAQTISHRYNFLLLGGQKNSKTQEIEVAKDGRVKTFFRHYFEKVKYTENLISRIFVSLISALTSSGVNATKLASDTKKVEIEYDSNRNLLEAHEEIDMGNGIDTQKISLNFSGEYMTQKTTGFMGQKYRDRAVSALEQYSGVDPLIPKMLLNDYLKAPILVSGHYQVNTYGIRYFNSLSTDVVFDHIDDLCNDKSRTGFFIFRNLFDNCRRSLENYYISYIKDVGHNKITSIDIASCTKEADDYGMTSGKRRAFIKNCLSAASIKEKGEWTSIPLWPLKNLTQALVNNSNNKVDFYNLFGLPNVFFYGSVDAVTADNRAFTSFFHEGAFQGFGAVDNYMRKENLRSPASIVIGE